MRDWDSQKLIAPARPIVCVGMEHDWQKLFHKHLYIVPMHGVESIKDRHYNELRTTDCYYLLKKIMARNYIREVYILQGISAIMVWVYKHAAKLQTCDDGAELYFENVAFVD